jgi:hypothetical protein
VSELFDEQHTSDVIRHINAILASDSRYRVTEFGAEGERQRTAVAYQRRDSALRTHVFATFADRWAIGYVTLPREPEPLHQTQLLWYWTEADAYGVLGRFTQVTSEKLDHAVQVSYPERFRLPPSNTVRYTRWERR